MKVYRPSYLNRNLFQILRDPKVSRIDMYREFHDHKSDRYIVPERIYKKLTDRAVVLQIMKFKKKNRHE